jgi:hypothetical protein
MPSAEEKSDSRLALENVYALLGRPLGSAGQDTADAAHAKTAVLPTARARAALEEFAQCATIEELNAKQLNLKVVCRELFDWHDQGARSNGTVVKSVARSLLATDENGKSLFPQAVEMLGFAAAASPLLQPDRLARLIDESVKVKTAFAPDRYMVRLAGALRTVLERYPDQRRETLLVSLWHAAHDGRWWDITSGVHTVAMPRGRRTAELQARAQAEAEIVATALDGTTRGTPEAHAAVTSALISESLPYNEGTAALVAELPPLVALRDGLAEASEKMRAGQPVYPDKVLLMSLIDWAAPDERSESPIAWMTRVLVKALTEDPETGIVMLERLPEKPKTWKDLYPQADLTGFPHPPLARVLDGRMFQGTEVEVRVVKNAAELAANREYMGNCTYSYKDRMEKGAYVLFQLWDGNDCYNLSLVANQVGEAWRVGEVNSRFNQGGVPEHVRAIGTTIAEGLPPRTGTTEREARAAQQYRADV